MGGQLLARYLFAFGKRESAKSNQIIMEKAYATGVELVK
jgi:hypothetical protein